MRPSFDRKAGIKLDVTTAKKWMYSRISWVNDKGENEPFLRCVALLVF